MRSSVIMAFLLAGVTLGILACSGPDDRAGFREPLGKNLVYEHGGIVRTDPSQKNINLVFSADSQVDGYETIREVLKRHGIKAAFFFTGNFYRNPDFAHMVEALKDDGMYIGAHSDRHLLYCSWENRDSTLVTKEEMINDLEANYAEMAKFGISKEDAPYYMPPYEWYNSEICGWCREWGVSIINMTPDTWTNQDWTIPDSDFPYYSNDDLYGRLIDFERNDPNGLGGTILLIHFGTDPRRPEKLYDRLDSMIEEFKSRGYRFTSLTETIR